jgi:hypothetical protein
VGTADYSSITANQGGAGTLTINSIGSLANITNTYSATGATTLNFGTTTQRVANFTATGTAGNVLTIQGTSATSPCTLIHTGAGDIQHRLCDHHRREGVSDMTWYAGDNSTNNGSFGWLFEAPGGGSVDVPVTGVEATGAVGSVTIPNVDVSVTGVTATGEVGIATAFVPDALVVVTGVSATGQVGTVTVEASATANATGVSATGQVGSLLRSQPPPLPSQ